MNESSLLGEHCPRLQALKKSMQIPPWGGGGVGRQARCWDGSQKLRESDGSHSVRGKC